MFNLTLAGSLLGLLLAQPALAMTTATVVPSGRVTVELVTVNGSGCPAGTAKVSAAADNTGFTVTYSNYEATTGGKAGPTDFRKNCQLNLLVSVPQGFTYAIGKAAYRGSAALPTGASGIEQAAYYFQGSSDTAYVAHQFDGPYSGAWQATDAVDAAALVFAPCGVQRNLNINTELRVDAGTSDPSATSVMTMSSTRASIQTVYQFSWRSCP